VEGIYKIVFESILEGLILVNKSGVIELVNPRTEEMFGYQTGELIGQKIECLIPTRFHKNHESYRDGYVEKPTKRTMGSGMNLWGKRKDNTDFPVEISLNYIKSSTDETYVVALISDISIRKRAQDEVLKMNDNLEKLVLERSESLFESEQLYKSIAKNYPSGIIYILDLDFKIRFVEGRELNNFAVNSTDLISKNYLDTCEKDKESIASLLKNLIKDGVCELIEISKNGEHYSINASLLWNAEGELTSILVVENNITLQHNTSRQLESNLREERQLNELKSRFVSMASHEFRTPLTTISSSAGLIKAYAEKNDCEKINKHSERIRTTVGHLTTLLNDFLSLEKLESGKISFNPTAFCIKLFIEELREDLAGTLKENQQIELAGDAIEIVTDSFFLKAILMNLLSNASKYAPVSTTIHVNWFIENNMLTLSVTDQGIGIPKEEQELLFERFFRAGNVVNIQGTGLGLFIVKKYLDLLNGSISFTSQENIGSTFKIQIPTTHT
jgi:PAS domain S-box-containing protein